MLPLAKNPSHGVFAHNRFLQTTGTASQTETGVGFSNLNDQYRRTEQDHLILPRCRNAVFYRPATVHAGSCSLVRFLASYGCGSFLNGRRDANREGNLDLYGNPNDYVLSATAHTQEEFRPPIQTHWRRFLRIEMQTFAQWADPCERGKCQVCSTKKRGRMWQDSTRLR